MKRQQIVDTVNSLQGESGHKKVVEVYNSQDKLPRGYRLKLSDAWCAATVSAVFLMNGCNAFSECSCQEMIKKAQAVGMWVENDNYRPSVGDVMLYDWQDSGSGDNKGVADHVGIVVETSGETIYVREGNKSGSIGNRVMRVNGRYIRGYITPRYEVADQIYTEDTPLRVLVDDIIMGRLGDGAVRKNNIYNVIQGLVNDRLTQRK